jgi:hypothetical protein
MCGEFLLMMLQYLSVFLVVVSVFAFTLLPLLTGTLPRHLSYYVIPHISEFSYEATSLSFPSPCSCTSSFLHPGGRIDCSEFQTRFQDNIFAGKRILANHAVLSSI